MTLSDVLDGAFRLYRANARALITFAAIFIVPLQLVAAAVGRGVVAGPLSDAIVEAADDPGIVGSDLTDAIVEVVSGLAVIVALPFVAGGVSLIVARSYLGGRVDAGTALRVAGRRWWPLAASWVLVHLAATAGLLFCIVPGVVLWTMFVAVPAAVVVEDRGPLAAMKRSAALVRGRIGPVFGITALAWILDGAISAALGWLVDLASFAVPGGWVVRVLGSTAVNVVTTPFVAIVAVLLYFDLRIRKEGFDLAVLATDVARRG